MDKPEDVPQWAWEASLKVIDEHLRGNESAQSAIARAILSAQSQAYIDAARIAKDLPLTEFKGASPSLLAPETLWTAGASVQAGSISAAILQRKEEIGR